MTTRTSEGVSDGSRDAYIQELYRKAFEEGDEKSFTELGEIAAGRSDMPLARELFQKLDSLEVEASG